MANARPYPHVHESRRRFLKGLGIAAAGAATTVVTPVAPAAAATGSGKRTFPERPGPKPIPQVIDTGAPDPFGLIHWLLPGPAGSFTPFNNLPGFGLDVDPSTVGDFDGFTAFAVIAGEATDRDGTDYDVEFDVRVMQGTYLDAHGNSHHGTFGFY